MCDVCDFVQEEAGRHDDDELVELIDQVALGDDPVDDLYLGLMAKFLGFEKRNFDREEVARFVRAVQLVWERHGLAAEVYEAGRAQGRKEGVDALMAERSVAILN